MNSCADDFTTDYYSEICYASSAAVDGLKEMGDYEADGNSHIRLLFLFIPVAFLNEAAARPTDDFVEFVCDTYYYLDDDLSDLIEASDISDKRAYFKDVRDSFDANSPVHKFGFDALKGAILNNLHLCQLGHESATKALTACVTRYTFLLINLDSNPSPNAVEFYEKVKWVLSLDLDSPDIEQHLQGLTGNSCRSDQQQTSDCNNATLTQSSSLKPIEELVTEINSLIGLNSIKAEVSELVNMLRVQQMRLAAGLPKPDTTNHMVFYGNPGTGKTTIARKLGEIYKSLNLLSKGHFIETDRAGLVAGYLGQTALKTREVLDSAKGGILFIDEAYTLSPPNDQDLFGQEAIDTILKYMEDNRDEIVVIVAGYQDRMERFISSNPGLKSRFGKYFYFPDYSSDELAAIFLDIVTKSSYSFAAGFRERLDAVCSVIIANKDDNFGNGRVMRNLFDRCISNHANRVIQIPNATSHQLMELSAEDLNDEDVDAVTR
jgi:stage V sporulation protein K